MRSRSSRSRTGRYHEALEAAWLLYEEDVPPHGSQALPEIVEAGSRSGHEHHATMALERLEERANASGTPWALGLLARSRALLSDDAEAEALYRSAIEHLGATVVKTDLARSHLVYGEWLRRQKRRQARASSSRSRTTCSSRWVPPRSPSAPASSSRLPAPPRGVARSRPLEELTAQEHQVARLAAGGATNNEIAGDTLHQRSTVDYHLRKVYRKLGHHLPSPAPHGRPGGRTTRSFVIRVRVDCPIVIRGTDSTREESR